MTLPRALAIRGATTPSRLPRKPPRIKRALCRDRTFLLLRLFLPLWSAVRRLRAVLWRLSLLCCAVVRGTVPVSTLWEHSATALTSPASAKPLARMRRTCLGLDLANRHKRSGCLRTAGVSPVLDFVLWPLVIATTPTSLLPCPFLVRFLLLLLFFPRLVPLAISLSRRRPDTKWAQDPHYAFFSHIREGTRKISDRK